MSNFGATAHGFGSNGELSAAARAALEQWEIDHPSGTTEIIEQASTPGTPLHDAVVAAATSIATDTAVPINRLPAGTVISTTSATTRPSTRSDLVCLWLGADPGENALADDVWLGS